MHDAGDNAENMQTNWLIFLIRVFKFKQQFKMTKVCNSKVLNYKLYGSSHQAMLINNTYNNSEKCLYSSLLLNTEYSALLVFSNFVKTFFDSLSFPLFFMTSYFWMTFNEGATEKAVENTTKTEKFCILFLNIVHELCNPRHLLL